ncbi:Rhomboid-related protein 3, partial [Stegodyphus mimosarum]
MRGEIKVSPPHRSVSKDWDPIDMELQWKPVFDKYDVDKDGKIPLCHLKAALKSGGDLRHDFPDDVIDEILEWADINSDGQLTFDEFLRMVHAKELGDSRPKFQRIVRFAALAVVPKNQCAITVRRYIEEYNCYPPPIFLLLISLIEIGIFIYYCVTLKELTAAGPVPFQSVLIYNPKR